MIQALKGGGYNTSSTAGNKEKMHSHHLPVPLGISHSRNNYYVYVGEDRFQALGVESRRGPTISVLTIQQESLLSSSQTYWMVLCENPHVGLIEVSSSLTLVPEIWKL